MICRWCEAEFPDMTRGGEVKVYCSPACKNAWNSAARVYVREMEERRALRLADWWNHRSIDREA